MYGVHPYQLLNFNGRYEDLTTLAHESGHSMHTFLSHAAQPYPTADYPIFVAEVASTFNENLLIHYMLGRAKDDATRLFLLGTLLDGLRTTLFRQTQFAEFELAIHEQAERGEPLTGENLSTLYLKIARDYYGHDKQGLPGRRSARRSSGPTCRTSITTSTSTSTRPAWSPRRRWRGPCGKRPSDRARPRAATLS